MTSDLKSFLLNSPWDSRNLFQPSSMFDNMKLLGIWKKLLSYYSGSLPQHQHPSRSTEQLLCHHGKGKTTSLAPVQLFPGYYVVMAYLASHAFCFDGIGLVLVPGFTGAKAEDSVGRKFRERTGSGVMEICCGLDVQTF